MHRRIALILVVVLIGLLCIHSLDSINQDISRHLKSGEIIWTQKSVYKTNLFSFTEPNHPFINHHWLGEVFYYLTSVAGGLKSLIILKAILIALASALILWSVSPVARTWQILLSVAVAAPMFLTRTDVRPEAFSYLFLGWFLFVLLRTKYHPFSKQNIWFWSLPLIQIIWSNTHIYFAVGPMIMLFFLIDRHFLDKENVGKYFKLFLAVCLATLINPNFIKGAIAPLTILSEYGYSIVENQNLFFLRDIGFHLRDINFFQLALVALVVFAFLAVKKAGFKKLTFELLLNLTMIILAIKMVRNLGLFGWTLIPTLAIYINLATSAFKPSSRASKIAYAAAFGAMVWFFTLIPTSSIHAFLKHPQKWGLIIPSGAEKAVEYVKEKGISGPVFNNFDVGSFLIWKLYPEQKVFVDGRPEAYSVKFFEEIYKPMQMDPALWEKYSEQYGINYIFFSYKEATPWAQMFLYNISQNPKWEETYRDETIVIFERR